MRVGLARGCIWILSLAVSCLGMAAAAGVEPTKTATSRPSASVDRIVDGRVGDWVARSPLVGGATEVSSGEFVYQDYLFDDAGADAGSPFNVNDFYYRGVTNPVGDVLYPNEVDRCRNNCADLLEFRVALDGDRVHFLIRLNTLLEPDSTVAAIALGPAGQDGGELRAWPFQANIATPGTQHVITVWGTGGAFDDAGLESVGGTVAVDVEANAIEVSVPVALVGQRFRAYAGTGLWDSAAQHWQAIHEVRTYSEPGLRQAYDGLDYSTPVSPPRPELPRVFNLAFRAGEVGNWFEDAQGKALAAGDISAFHADIDLHAPDRAAQPFVTGGWVQRMYTSSVTIPPGEGVFANSLAAKGRGFYCCVAGVPIPTQFHFLGQLQPYALYVPEAGYQRAMLANHPGLSSHGASTLAAGYAALAESANAVMVTPLARGVSSYCTDWAHLDVMEAWDDALSLFPHGPRGGRQRESGFIDTDRNMLWGYSMGGLCSARLAVLQPDEFASAVQWAASTDLQEDHEPADSAAGHPANGNELDLMQNTRGVTWRINHCAADELSPYNGVLLHAQRLEELGYVHNFRSLLGGEHLTCGIGGYADDAAGTDAAVIDHKPARVTYTTEEGWWRPDISPKLVFDHAYWVSGLRTREQSEAGENRTAYGTVDATTQGLTGKQAFATEASGLGSGVSGWPYTETGRVPAEGAPIEQANAFEATLTNLRAVTFDLERMGLTVERDLTGTLSTDGSTAITLTDAAGSTVTCDPACGQTQDSGDDLVISLSEAGNYELIVRRVAGGPPASAATGPQERSETLRDSDAVVASAGRSGATLPATGGGPGVWAVLLIAGGAVLRAARRRLTKTTPPSH